MFAFDFVLDYAIVKRRLRLGDCLRKFINLNFCFLCTIFIQTLKHIEELMKTWSQLSAVAINSRQTGSLFLYQAFRWIHALLFSANRSTNSPLTCFQMCKIKRTQVKNTISVQPRMRTLKKTFQSESLMMLTVDEIDDFLVINLSFIGGPCNTSLRKGCAISCVD